MFEHCDDFQIGSVTPRTSSGDAARTRPLPESRLARGLLPESRFARLGLLDMRLARGNLLEMRLARLTKRKNSRNALAKRNSDRNALAKRVSNKGLLAKRNTSRNALVKRKKRQTSVCRHVKKVALHHACILPRCRQGGHTRIIRVIISQRSSIHLRGVRILPLSIRCLLELHSVTWRWTCPARRR